MGFFKVVAPFFLSCSLLAAPLQKEHVAYLMQQNNIVGALNLYEEYRSALGRHDFEILVQLCTIILDQGIRSSDLAIQLSSLYGTSVSTLVSSLDILEQGMHSNNIETQLAALHMLADLHDDRGDALLIKAMASPFLVVRMESGYRLAERKHKKATGQIEALMAKIPPEFWFYFPQFFALIGTHEAICALKELMESPSPMTRVEAILSVARAGRDDLLPRIRSHATHSSPDEQEAAAFALGALLDSHSTAKLQRLTRSPAIPVKLAAHQALYELGSTQDLFPIFDLAKQGDLFAIAQLGTLPGGQEVLAQLLEHSNSHIRFNATLSLLMQRDARCLNTLFEFLLVDSRGLGFQPTVSPGHAFTAWKVVPAESLRKQNPALDLSGISWQLRQQMLTLSLELEESHFLSVVSAIFHSRSLDLVPLAVHLLENHASEKALHLLKTQAEFATAPLTRMYCNLALFRLKQKGPYAARLKAWLKEANKLELIKFRAAIPWNLRSTLSTYELTPQETTRLLVECYEALSEEHTEESIDTLVHSLRSGHPKNRYALAGLLIRALQ